MKYKPPVNPWEVPELAASEIMALKGLAAGAASQQQQKIALVTILQKFCGVYDMSFRPGPDGARATDFAEGKRFVGSRILNAIDRPLPTQTPQEPEKNDGTSPSSSTAEARPDRRNPKPPRRRSKPTRPAE